MRKYVVLGAVVLGFALSSVAYAATLDISKFGDLTSQGAACAHGAVYHFVNNQLGNAGLADGTITFQFSGHSIGSAGASFNNGPTQHFFVTSTGTLQSASTNLPGKLVLSSVACAKKK
jgi:hypothetical protein